MQVEYPGAIYHVMDRGDRREDISVNDVDRYDFLKTLAQACHKTGSQAHEAALKPFRRGWCLGREQFRQKMIDLMGGKPGESHSGELHGETAEQKANRVISQELSRSGWTEADLPSRLKNDPGKRAMAGQVRKETTLPVKWVVARLQKDSPKNVKLMLYNFTHP
jgi:hypothetical protein